MRTVYKKFTVYHFDELSEQAKAKVYEEYALSLFDCADIYEDDCGSELKEKFPHSKLKIQYNIDCCHDSGFNVYGDLSLIDAVGLIKDKLTKKEYHFMKWALSEFTNTVSLPCNWRGVYCMTDEYDYTNDLEGELEYNGIRAIPYNTLEKINTLIAQLLTGLCNKLKNRGYDFFYPDLTDDDIREWAEANEFEFTADGKIF